MVFLSMRRNGTDIMDEKERYDIGDARRREVIGDEVVDRFTVNRNEFNDEFQEMVTRHAWGEVWARPGLDKKTRSMLVLAMLTALNRDVEFKLHVAAALNNGVTRDEIKEVLLQAAVYCGVPAANSSFRWAKEVFAEVDGG